VDGFGASLYQGDGDPPMVSAVDATFLADAPAEISVTFSEVMDPQTVQRFSVYGLIGPDELLHASGSPSTADNRTFQFPFAGLNCDQDLAFHVDRSAADATGQMMSVSATRVIQGEDVNPPTITCPEPLYVNSTTAFDIPAGDVTDHEAIQEFLDAVEASDLCTNRALLVPSTSLDEPHDLPLGVNEVTFTVTDQAGNVATCDALIIVVPAVPLEGLPGEPGQDGSDGSDGTSGSDGADGTNGLACWDLNENGVADPGEDTNGDSEVNVFDCRAATPTNDPLGRPTSDNPDACGGFCGALGMVNLLWMVAGLEAMRAGARRRRGGARG
jgi:hypothetical protein